MRTQCEKCPWKVSTDPYEIHRGYCPEKNLALESTIAEPSSLRVDGKLYIMACHETQALPCVGGLRQFGPGNNLLLRFRCIPGGIDADVETVGSQHESFDATLPWRRRPP